MHVSRLGLAGGIAALVVSSASVGAGAAGLIRSKDIANDSLRSVDIKNGTITGRDVHDGSLTADDVAGGLKVRSGPDWVVTWSGTYTTDGAPAGLEVPLVTSTDTIPSNSLVRGLSMEITGGQDSCRSLQVQARPVPGVQIRNATFASANNDYADPARSFTHFDDALTSQSEALPIQLAASCDYGDGPVPTFGFTVTFSITQLESAPTGTFQ